ncbi:MAG: FAD-dependent oxidoreductase [Dictyoglomi bacterium]|nr:FAD-dependent oxidoreductase [Dictyoglomota bacterium]
MKVAVIGAGSAGMEAAKTLASNGVKTVLVDVEERMGGILNQCIHPGFGLHMFGEELTGPEFAQRLEDTIKDLNIDVRTNTYVKALQVKDGKKSLVLQAPKLGEYEEEFDKIIIATGARERTPAGILTPGHRVAGIYTAGLAQTFTNIKGWLPGNKVLIVGSGDVGLIMARRLTLEGAEVVGVIEINPFPGGLPRNVKACLEDFGIPLYLSRKVIHIEGKDGRVHKVYVAKVDEQWNIISDDYEVFEVDTVLFSVGLIPNTGLLKHYVPIKKGFYVDFDQNFMTDIPGVHIIGNSAMIFDLADHASLSGKMAANAILSEIVIDKKIPVVSEGLTVYPSHITLPLLENCVKIFIRVRRPVASATIHVSTDHGQIKHEIKDIVPAQMLEVCVPGDMLKTAFALNVALEVHE